MIIGVNIDPMWTPNISVLAASGLQGTRFPARHNRPYTRFVRAVQAHEIDVLVIVTNEWFTATEQRQHDWERAFRRLRRAYPSVTMVQVGNEEDQRGESSEYRPAAEYTAFLAAARRGVGPDITLVAGGAVSGDPRYFDRVDLSPADVMAVHPYAKDGSTVRPLLRSYRRFGLPLWATEFGAPTQDFRDEHERARYHSGMLVAMADEGIERAYVYNWWDRQGPAGFGLLDRKGQPKETYAAVVDAVSALAVAA